MSLIQVSLMSGTHTYYAAMGMSYDDIQVSNADVYVTVKLRYHRPHVVLGVHKYLCLAGNGPSVHTGTAEGSQAALVSLRPRWVG